MSDEREPLWSDERIGINSSEATDELDGNAYVYHVISQLLVKIRDDYEAQLANQYQRIEGFVELVDQLEAQLAQRDAIPPDVREAIITLCEVNEYHWAARHLHKWLDQQEDRP